MTNVFTLFKRTYMDAADVGYSDKTLTIKAVVAETIADKTYPVVHFASGMPLVLTRALADQISECLGTDVELWPGKAITLTTYLPRDVREPVVAVRSAAGGYRWGSR